MKAQDLDLDKILNRIDFKLIELGVTRTELEARLGLAKGSLHNYWRRKTKGGKQIWFRLDQFIEICHILGMGFDELLFGAVPVKFDESTTRGRMINWILKMPEDDFSRVQAGIELLTGKRF
jgi:transcriptional regulator with XRE-family HTH domain